MSKMKNRIKQSIVSGISFYSPVWLAFLISDKPIKPSLAYAIPAFLGPLFVPIAISWYLRSKRHWEISWISWLIGIWLFGYLTFAMLGLINPSDDGHLWPRPDTFSTSLMPLLGEIGMVLAAPFAVALIAGFYLGYGPALALLTPVYLFLSLRQFVRNRGQAKLGREADRENIAKSE